MSTHTCNGLLTIVGGVGVEVTAEQVKPTRLTSKLQFRNSARLDLHPRLLRKLLKEFGFDPEPDPPYSRGSMTPERLNPLWKPQCILSTQKAVCFRDTTKVMT